MITRNGQAKGHASNVHMSKFVVCLLPGLHDRTASRSCKCKRNTNATEAAASQLTVTSMLSLLSSSLSATSIDSANSTVDAHDVAQHKVDP